MRLPLALSCLALTVAAASCDEPEDNVHWGECYHRAGTDICLACCQQSHPTGVVLASRFATACACVDPAACMAECENTLCAAPPETPDAPCAACLRGALVAGGACEAVDDQCDTDEDCEDYSHCIKIC